MRGIIQLSRSERIASKMFWALILCSISFILGSPIEKTGKNTPQYFGPRILYYYNNNDGSGNYNYEFETSDGISKNEVGRLSIGEENEFEATGSYNYIGDDGRTYKISYIADKNGYRPSGDVIPRRDNFVIEDFGSIPN